MIPINSAITESNTKMCSSVTQHTDDTRFEGACLCLCLLTAGMFTSPPVSWEVKVHFTVISRLQCCFREFSSTYNQPHNHRSFVTTTPDKDLQNRLLHLYDQCGSWFAKPKNFCTNCQKASQGSSYAFCSS